MQRNANNRYISISIISSISRIGSISIIRRERGGGREIEVREGGREVREGCPGVDVTLICG